VPRTKLRPSLRGSAPSTKAEQALWESGIGTVVGLDEVGKGAWAGPLSVGAVVVPHDRRLARVRDSKLLTEAEREALFDQLLEWVEAAAVGHASPRECDELGMSAAQRLAARRAIEGLRVEPGHHLMDGSWNFVGGSNSTTIVKGDRSCLSIAAASVIAKVTRDRMMRMAAEEHPPFEFETNKGYPSPRHRVVLQGYGPSSIHRRSWAFMDGIHFSGVTRLAPAGQTRLL